MLATTGVWLMFTPGAPARASSFTWTGRSTTSEDWSAAANWRGREAPSPGETVETLSFPRLTKACEEELPAHPCYVSADDIGGLTVESMEIDDGNDYLLEGERPLGLGRGGLDASPASGTSGYAGTFLRMPLELDASQRWTIADRDGGHVGENGLLLGKRVAGAPGTALTIEQSNGSELVLANETDVGPLTIEANSTSKEDLENGVVLIDDGELNSADKQPVDLKHIYFEGIGAVGALRTEGVTLVVGNEEAEEPEAISAASVRLDSASDVRFQINGSGTVAGDEYSQLVSSGEVDLAGDLEVELRPRSEGAPCPVPAAGTTYRLLTARGALSGVFENAPEAAELPIYLAGSCNRVFQKMRITYTDSGDVATVTGTVVDPASSTTLSTPPGNPVTNQSVTLTATVNGDGGRLEGTVEFRNGGAAIPSCSSVPVPFTDSTGTAECRTSLAAGGSPEHLSATFNPSPDVGLLPSTGTTELFVGRATTTATLQVSNSTPYAGASVTYALAVSPSVAGVVSPSGVVEFFDDGMPIGPCVAQPLSITASCVVSYASTGTHSITAQYQGDANFLGSSSPPQTVTVQPPIPQSVVGEANEIGVNDEQKAAAGTHPEEEAGKMGVLGVKEVSPDATVAGTALTVNPSGTFIVEIRCPSGEASCIGTIALRTLHAVAVSVSGRDAKSKTAIITLASGSFEVAGGHVKSVTLRLSRTGLKLLARRHRLSARTTIVAHNLTGGTHTGETIVTLRAQKSKPH